MKTSNKKTKNRELKGLLYIVLFMSIFTNCIGIYSFITDGSDFESLDVFTKILAVLLLVLVWAIEPAIKTAWEKIWVGQLRFLSLVIPLTLCSVAFTSWGLKHIAINNNNRIEHKIIDTSSLDSLNIQIEEIYQNKEDISKGKVRAFVNSSGVLYRSGVIKLQQLQEDLHNLEVRRDTLEQRISSAQLKAENTYNKKVQDFELLATGFSGTFQLVSIVLIFLMNYTPKKAKIQLPRIKRSKVVRTSPELLRIRLRSIPKEIQASYKRTIFNPDNLELVIAILLNEAGEKLSFRELAEKEDTSHSKIQRYTSHLKDINLL